MTFPPARALVAVALSLAVAMTGSGSAAASADAPPAADLQRTLRPKLEALAARSGGTVAVTVLDLASGRRVSVGGSKRMPMMSVFKLPLALATLAAVDDGTHSLGERVPLRADELRHTYSVVAERWEKGETAPTLETLVREAVQTSDNTAGEKLVLLNGGGPAITARLRAMGIEGVDVAEQEIEIFARTECPGAPRPAGGWTPATFAACERAPRAKQVAALRHEAEAPPNGATSDALATLLAKLQRGEILSERSRAWLMSVLEGTTTGAHRIKAGLPPGTPLAHKTGTGDTIGGVNMATNDIGLVTLPDGSRFALAVLTSGVPGPEAEREAVIARIARTAYDALAGGR